jgi:putative nucleotidyltransferase with HDIG domain
MAFLKKVSPRRSQVRKNISDERFSKISQLLNTDSLISILLWCLFVVLCVPILTFEYIQQAQYLNLVVISVIVVLVCLAMAFYIYHYQKRIITNHSRALALVGLYILLLGITKLITFSFNHTSVATGCAVTAAVILTIAYNQRFAIGMVMFYCLLACFATGGLKGYQLTGINLFMTMLAGALTCCFSLREIRTRMKLLKVSTLAATFVFITAFSLSSFDLSAQRLLPTDIQGLSLADTFSIAGYHAGATFLVGLLIQSLLPLIEKVFNIATSMTLLDYSDANQPLLRKLAMEAPGTFSHSLLIGSVAEAAAEAIGRNGLLCRVGAYYHDIGKINKANYFIENEFGSASRHKELSPTMSQLIIVGHVKDGIEMAKEYGLPGVIRQFIETHHGTTLIEHFYNEARKLKMKNSKGKSVDEPSESEFRYPGPKPRTKEAAIVMLADTIEGAVRSLPEVTPTKVEAVVHTMSMRRLQDGQFDECDMSLRELSQIEASISKTLAAHHHGRIAYPKPPDRPVEEETETEEVKQSSS